MSHSNGKITAPVGIDADIAPVLGVANYDLGYLCSNAHGKINMWARYKPVRYPSLAPAAGEQWWKSTNGNCGIKPYKIANYKDSVNHADGSLNGWVYEPPFGGDTAPYRALDFDGYNHNARGPIGSFNVPPTSSNKLTNSSFTAAAAILVPTDGSITDELNLGDIGEIKDYYFGVYVRKKGATLSAIRVTSQTYIGNGSALVEVNTYGWELGTYEVFPFLSDQILSQDGIDVNSTYYSCPYMEKQEIEIVGSDIKITVIPGFLPYVGDSYVNVKVKVTNNSGDSMTLSSNQWKVRYTNKNQFAEAITDGESQGNFDPITVPGNSTVEKTVSCYVSQKMVEAGQARVWISLNAGAYLSKAVFMASAN